MVPRQLRADQRNGLRQLVPDVLHRDLLRGAEPVLRQHVDRTGPVRRRLHRIVRDLLQNLDPLLEAAPEPLPQRRGRPPRSARVGARSAAMPQLPVAVRRHHQRAGGGGLFVGLLLMGSPRFVAHLGSVRMLLRSPRRDSRSPLASNLVRPLSRRSVPILPPVWRSVCRHRRPSVPTPPADQGASSKMPPPVPMRPASVPARRVSRGLPAHAAGGIDDPTRRGAPPERVDALRRGRGC